MKTTVRNRLILAVPALLTFIAGICLEKDPVISFVIVISATVLVRLIGDRISFE